MHQAWNLMVKDWGFWLHEQHDFFVAIMHINRGAW
jgi:hypothetical protein